MEMTRGEAIQHILFHAYGCDLSDKETCALQMAIESLTREDKAEAIIWNTTYDGHKIIELRKLYPRQTKG